MEEGEVGRAVEMGLFWLHWLRHLVFTPQSSCLQTGWCSEEFGLHVIVHLSCCLGQGWGLEQENVSMFQADTTKQSQVPFPEPMSWSPINHWERLSMSSGHSWIFIFIRKFPKGQNFFIIVCSSLLFYINLNDHEEQCPKTCPFWGPWFDQRFIYTLYSHCHRWNRWKKKMIQEHKKEN